MDDLTALYQILRSGWTVAGVVLIVGIVVWAYRPSRKAEMDAHARIPLDGKD
jgi:cbb3-type cytochrome oxidase subunit 3